MKLYFDVMPCDLFFNVLYQIQKVILEIVTPSCITESNALPDVTMEIYRYQVIGLLSCVPLVYFSSRSNDYHSSSQLAPSIPFCQVSVEYRDIIDGLEILR